MTKLAIFDCFTSLSEDHENTLPAALHITIEYMQQLRGLHNS